MTGLGLVLSWLDVAPHDDSRDGAAALFDARLERCGRAVLARVDLYVAFEI